VGLLVSAAEAARLCGVNEHTVREWITKGRLPAAPAGPRTKRPKHGAQGPVGPSRWQINTDDLARVAGVLLSRDALAMLEAQRGRTQAGILARLETQERELQALRARVRVLELGQQGQGAWSSSAPASLADVAGLPPADGLGAGGTVASSWSLGAPATPPWAASLAPVAVAAAPAAEDGLPAGSVRFLPFARAHGVKPPTATSQRQSGHLQALSLPSAREGQEDHWLTPAQQRDAVAYWRTHPDRATGKPQLKNTCPDCPHDLLAE
jgi:hypothetical protein